MNTAASARIHMLPIGYIFHLLSLHDEVRSSEVLFGMYNVFLLWQKLVVGLEITRK